MKYTYTISFNGSDYVDLIPNNEIIMSGEWTEGTKVWREEISELKITKSLNLNTYNTLESWFNDDTKFETRIYVKILKDLVEDSVHWFGIKWGRINIDLKTYTVQPIVYDLWSQYIEFNLDKSPFSVSNLVSVSLYDNTGDFPYLQNISCRRMWDGFESIVISNTDLVAGDIVSTFMDNDQYEDTSTESDTFGMKRDYVTDGRSYIYWMHISSVDRVSIQWWFDLFKLFRVYPFFDSNDKLRLEHIKFYNEKLSDNSVDFSSYIKSYDDIWLYSTPDLITNEKLKLTIPQDATYDNFSDLDIIYSEIRNRPDAQNPEYTFAIIADLGAYGSTTIDDNPLLIGGFQNYVYDIVNVDFVSFTSDVNQFSFGWTAISQRAESRDMRVTNSTGYSISITLTTFISASGGLQFYLEDRSSGVQISNAIPIGAVTTVTGTLTTTAAAADAMLVIESISGATGQAVGYVNITKSGDGYPAPTYTDIDTNDKTNGTVSMGNIVDRWWQDDRAARDGTIEGTPYNFDGTQYNLKRETLKFHYADVVNPLYGFDDGTRVGMIEKWQRSLDTDFYEIDVIYQEDE